MSLLLVVMPYALRRVSGSILVSVASVGDEYRDSDGAAAEEGVGQLASVRSSKAARASSAVGFCG